jgi:hypothetical protein
MVLLRRGSIAQKAAGKLLLADGYSICGSIIAA